MPKRKRGWLVGRTHHVRVYLTAEEHAVVKAAAYLAGRSVSRYSIETIVEAARKAVPESMPLPGQPKAKKGGRK